MRTTTTTKTAKANPQSVVEAVDADHVGVCGQLAAQDEVQQSIAEGGQDADQQNGDGEDYAEVFHVIRTRTSGTFRHGLSCETHGSEASPGT